MATTLGDGLEAVRAQPEQTWLEIFFVLTFLSFQLLPKYIHCFTMKSSPSAHTADAVLLSFGSFSPGLHSAQVRHVQAGGDQGVRGLQPVPTGGAGRLRKSKLDSNNLTIGKISRQDTFHLQD